MTFCAINDKKEKNLQVIWDLGRRCTYSCSYCPPHRKNNWSATASYDELVKVADNLQRYGEIYNQYRNEEFVISCSFTGGEPTVNPSFFPFLEYLTKNFPNMKRTLTTNGFYTERRLRQVIENTEFTTVSYHTEATENQKKQVRQNMVSMVKANYNFKVNVMFHQKDEYFNECIDLCEWLDDLGVMYTPRVIGDQGEIKEGIEDNTVHRYSTDQMSWFKNYWSTHGKTAQAKKPITASTLLRDDTAAKDGKTIIGQSLGRPCCGGRTFEILNNSDGWQGTKFVPQNNFQGWSCMVNWYFLYIHQEIDQIWHHQTCQVNLDGKMGPICRASEFDKFCDSLEQRMSKEGTIPYIRCPKTYCGCGLCAPKAKDDDSALEIFDAHTKNIKPVLMSQQKDPGSGTLRALVYKFDADNGNETV